MSPRPPTLQGRPRPQTIGEVIDVLAALVDWSHDQDARHGFFGQVYLAVTREVARGLEAGEFTNPALLERLDVIFALRYIDAFDAWATGAPVSASWKVSFEADRDHPLMVLQHVLLGMNAHINLDLGVASAAVAPGPEIDGLKADFDQINDLLGRMVDKVEDALGSTNPLLALGDRLIGGVDEALIAFSIKAARKAAWRQARALAGAAPEDLPAAISALDSDVAGLARLVVGDRFTRGLGAPIRALERRTPREVIELLRAL